MKKKVTTETVACDLCDLCDKEIKDGYSEWLDVRVGSKEKQICKDCFKILEAPLHRILYNEVPTRRGGYRTLGEYDSLS